MAVLILKGECFNTKGDFIDKLYNYNTGEGLLWG